MKNFIQLFLSLASNVMSSSTATHKSNSTSKLNYRNIDNGGSSIKSVLSIDNTFVVSLHRDYVQRSTCDVRPFQLPLIFLHHINPTGKHLDPTTGKTPKKRKKKKYQTSGGGAWLNSKIFVIRAGH